MIGDWCVGGGGECVVHVCVLDWDGCIQVGLFQSYSILSDYTLSETKCLTHVFLHSRKNRKVRTVMSLSTVFLMLALSTHNENVLMYCCQFTTRRLCFDG